jgi:hypothetical protein
LARLLAEVMDNNRLDCHLDNIGRMGAVKFRTKKLRQDVP